MKKLGQPYEIVSFTTLYTQLRSHLNATPSFYYSPNPDSPLILSDIPILSDVPITHRHIVVLHYRFDRSYIITPHDNYSVSTFKIDGHLFINITLQSQPSDSVYILGH